MVNLSLCLSKHLVMEIYLLLN